MDFLNNSAFVFLFPDIDKRSMHKPYPALAQHIADAGAEVFIIEVKWDKHRSLQECYFEATKKVQEIINEFKPPSTYFVGIGMGAMIAAHVGFMFRANGMLLCSMRPFFQEEIPLLPWGARRFAKRKIYKGRPKPSYPAQRIEVPTLFLQGEKEKRYLNEKVMESRARAFVNHELILVPKSRGKIRRKAYFGTLKSTILKMVGIEETTPTI